MDEGCMEFKSKVSFRKWISWCGWNNLIFWLQTLLYKPMMNNSSIANVLFNTVVVDELQIYYLQAFLTRLGVFFSSV